MSKKPAKTNKNAHSQKLGSIALPSYQSFTGEHFYTPLIIREKIRTLFFTGESATDVAKILGLSDMTVRRVLASDETVEIEKQLVAKQQRIVAASMLVGKSLVAAGKELDKEAEMGVAPRARMWLTRYGVVPAPIPQQQAAPQVGVFFGATPGAPPSPEALPTGQEKALVSRVVSHFEDMEKKFVLDVVAEPQKEAVPGGEGE